MASRWSEAAPGGDAAEESQALLDKNDKADRTVIAEFLEDRKQLEKKLEDLSKRNGELEAMVRGLEEQKVVSRTEAAAGDNEKRDRVPMNRASQHLLLDLVDFVLLIVWVYLYAVNIDAEDRASFIGVSFVLCGWGGVLLVQGIVNLIAPNIRMRLRNNILVVVGAGVLFLLLLKVFVAFWSSSCSPNGLGGLSFGDSDELNGSECIDENWILTIIFLFYAWRLLVWSSRGVKCCSGGRVQAVDDILRGELSYDLMRSSEPLHDVITGTRLQTLNIPRSKQIRVEFVALVETAYKIVNACVKLFLPLFIWSSEGGRRLDGVPTPTFDVREVDRSLDKTWLLDDTHYLPYLLLVSIVLSTGIEAGLAVAWEALLVSASSLKIEEKTFILARSDPNLKADGVGLSSVMSDSDIDKVWPSRLWAMSIPLVFLKNVVPVIEAALLCVVCRSEVVMMWVSVVLVIAAPIRFMIKVALDNRLFERMLDADMNLETVDKRDQEEVQRVLNQHVYNEILYDLAQIALQAWVMKQIRFKKVGDKRITHFPYKIFIDFLNMMSTVMDLVFLKGCEIFAKLADAPSLHGALKEILSDYKDDGATGSQTPKGPSEERFKSFGMTVTVNAEAVASFVKSTIDVEVRDLTAWTLRPSEIVDGAPRFTPSEHRNRLHRCQDLPPGTPFTVHGVNGSSLVLINASAERDGWELVWVPRAVVTFVSQA
eukprot:TRINITY_DN36884_c0_g1_i1.p1 TRINITY_DN36884_c0_g1~~TRINITY_DN36884_c0_g1_i1.p1  ORF type:complete len:711 (+),score=82.98 TRINITY_DN36884_c0_g1_i1:62-2194(+)